MSASGDPLLVDEWFRLADAFNALLRGDVMSGSEQLAALLETSPHILRRHLSEGTSGQLLLAVAQRAQTEPAAGPALQQLCEALFDSGQRRLAVYLESTIPIATLLADHEGMSRRVERALSCGLGEVALEQVASVFPGFLSRPELIRYNLRQLLSQPGVGESTLATLQSLARAAPGNPEVSLAFAELLVRSGDVSGAQREYARAASSEPGFHVPGRSASGLALLEDFREIHRSNLFPRLQHFHTPFSTVLLHFYCTGGISFGRALARLFQRWEVREGVIQTEIEAFLREIEHAHYQIPFVHWHSGGGWRVPFPAEQCRIVTLVRDPVRRFLSFFNTLSAYDPPREGSPPPILERSGIEKFLEWACANGHGNSWSRCVCELELDTALVSSFTEEQLYHSASEILKRRFALVGITEHFDASLAVCSMLLGESRFPKWSHSFQSSTYATSLRESDLSAGTKNRIRAAFRVDERLYNECRAHFEQAYEPVIRYFRETGISLAEQAASDASSQFAGCASLMSSS